MFKQIARISVASLTFAAAMTSQAGTVTVFDTVPVGTAMFDAIVTSSGGTVTADVWNTLASPDGVVYARPGYTVASTDADSRGTRTFPGLTGQSIELDNADRYANPLPPANVSGLTFQFDNPINAFGIEVGDWGSCCWPSTLWVSFDGGAPIAVGTSTQLGDTPSAIFVAALDDTGSFSTVQFWGNKFEDYLVVGGTVRYALVNQIDPTPGVPEPGTLALVGVGLAGLAALRRRRAS